MLDTPPPPGITTIGLMWQILHVTYEVKETFGMILYDGPYGPFLAMILHVLNIPQLPTTSHKISIF